jgi:hypothetical protein
MSKQDYYYVPPDKNGVSVMGHFLKCPKCERKIIVDFGINGTNHNLFVNAICGECLVVCEQFKEKYPEETERIEEFLKS